MLGCSSQFTPKENKDVVELRDKIGEIEATVPSLFLIPCEEKPRFDGTSLEEVAQAVIEHSRRSEECRLRHNGWIEWQKSK